MSSSGTPLKPKPAPGGDQDNAPGGSDRLPAADTVAAGHQNRCSLQDLRLGGVGVVVGVKATQDAAKRLADIGFIPGIRVEMLRPGKPCIVRVNGTCLGVGVQFQESILLTLLDVLPKRGQRQGSDPYA